MSFERLSRKTIKRPTEKYILQIRVIYEEDEEEKVLKDEVGNIINKDDVGNIKEEWVDIKELSGVIQHRQYEKEKNRILSISESGIESTIRYFGYFDPNFDLNTNELDDYRIKFIRNYETLYLKIIEYDPNNYLRGKQHHIVLGMDEDRKYDGRQRKRKNIDIDIDIPESIDIDNDVPINIELTKDATGYIIINGNYFFIINGKVRTTIPNLPLGKNNIKIIYSGDNQYDKAYFNRIINIQG